jgi:alpha-L-fucosidase 2
MNTNLQHGCLLLTFALCLVSAPQARSAEGVRLGERGPNYQVASRSLNLTDEVTLEAWVKADRMPQGGGRIVDKSVPGTQIGYMLDTYPGNSLRFLNAKGMCTFKANLGADEWTHVAGVYSASEKVMKLYLAGKEVASLGGEDFPPMKVSNVPLCIGTDPEGGNRFTGAILKAAIYRRALSADELAARAAAPDSPAPQGALGEWNFEPGAPAMLRPVVGNMRLMRGGSSLSTRYEGELLGQSVAPDEPLSLWYRRPAEQWVEALAIGNGRLGGMVFGGITRERLQLNECTLWAGGPYDPNNPEALAALPEARRLIFEGKYREADRLVNEKMIARPRGQMPFQTVGDLVLEFPESKSVLNYRRDLNLDTAVASVTYAANGVQFTRQVFASPADQVIVVRLSADKARSISFTAGFKTPQDATPRVERDNTLVLEGVNGAADRIAGALKFQARVAVRNEGGDVFGAEDRLVVTNANAVTLLITAATSYKSFKDVSGDPEARCREVLGPAAKKRFNALLKDHVAAHQKMFQRVSLDLGTSDAARLPTDERIKNFGAGNDPQLAVLYMQFGRYLLMGCSRPGGQAANLQGIWNDSMSPPWGGKYTININTEMNYWPVDSANLGECVEPLTSMVRDLSESGRKTAKVHWGAGGWVAHHNTDLWRAAAPIDGPWGHWPTGGAWLCQNLWEHFLFTNDRAFLERIYPAMKGAAEFFVDSLVPEPKQGWLVTCPSASPENPHPGRTSICAGPTMDQQIIRDLFSNCIRAGELLKRDADFCAKLRELQSRLAPNQIGKAGQLQEWLEDWDMEAPDIHHRHVSHLYGLYPSAQITMRGTPKLAAAVRKSLEVRGDDATGWGLGWRLNLWARLLDGEHAYQILKLLLRPDRTYPNMFDAHPPFQIDGNFGGTAGIIEMLLQSHDGEIELLPALPKNWPNGSAKGLKARGNVTVDLTWKAGKVVDYRLSSPEKRPVKLRVNGKQIQASTAETPPVR